MAADTMSYSQQFADLKGTTDPDVLLRTMPKPSMEAQARVPGATKAPFTKDTYIRTEQRPVVDIAPATMTKEAAVRKLRWNYFLRYLGFILGHYYLLWVGRNYWSWANLGKGMAVWMFTGCIGIGVSFHRQLTHKGFKSPKWLEYTFAALGTHAYQGHPAEWVTNHRVHHMHADTPLDLHSPYEGLFWSHFGWFSDFKAMVELPWVDYPVAKDLTSQWFYRFMEHTWFLQFVIRFVLTKVFLGTEGVVWTLAWPLVYGWHVAFLVASAGHLWGYRPYETGDLSTNCWWASWLTMGECWHNNHHAWAYSAQHGFEWWEVDVEYAIIKALQWVGLAWDVKVPSKKEREARRRRPQAASAARMIAAPAAQAKPLQPVRDGSETGPDSEAGCTSDGSEVDAVVRPAITVAGKKAGKVHAQ